MIDGAEPEKLSGYWWLLFIDKERPKGSRFLGFAIVPGSSIESAAMAAHVMGCHPGGKVDGMIIPAELMPDARWIGRLLNREEANRVYSQ